MSRAELYVGTNIAQATSTVCPHNKCAHPETDCAIYLSNDSFYVEVQTPKFNLVHCRLHGQNSKSGFTLNIPERNTEITIYIYIKIEIERYIIHI